MTAYMGSRLKFSPFSRVMILVGSISVLLNSVVGLAKELTNDNWFIHHRIIINPKAANENAFGKAQKANTEIPETNKSENIW